MKYNQVKYSIQTNIPSMQRTESKTEFVLHMLKQHKKAGLLSLRVAVLFLCAAQTHAEEVCR